MRVYVDSNVLIEFFEGGERKSLELARLFEIFDQRPSTAVTNLYTLGEVLGRQARHMDWEDQKTLYCELLVERGFIDVIPVDQSILLRAIDLRQRANLEGLRHRLPDAIHIASAASAACDCFLTADIRLARGLPLSIRSIAPSSDDLAALILSLDA